MGREYKPWWQRLKDPRWQKKRLEIMQRAGFACQSCESTDRTLHVHHTYYDRRDPWEYPNQSLLCLCEECHEELTDVLQALHVELGKLRAHCLERILWAIVNVDWESIPTQSALEIRVVDNGTDTHNQA